MERSEQNSKRTIIVCGGGLAGYLTVAHLCSQLTASHRIVFLPECGTPTFDFMYGSATSPSAYEFLRRIGLDEPNLIQNTATSFSLGTHIQKWPLEGSDWVQCHHLPLPALNAVSFQHHLFRDGSDLQALLVSSVAARAGKFAHPPQDPKIPLSRAEYGYQFNASGWVALIKEGLRQSNLEIFSKKVERVEVDGANVSGIVLETGEQVRGDLYIDCTGPERRIMTALGVPFTSRRTVSARESRERADRLGPAARHLIARPSGWEIKTFLQDTLSTVSIHVDGGENTLALGNVNDAWVGNCVAIGQSASVFEPLSPAPMLLLQADIERLLELIPVSDDCTMERREHNRRFKDDVSHARLFQDALVSSSEAFQTPFWEEAVVSAQSEALERKIMQFEHRGLLVKYDLEPFNDEDWLILHSGMGRRPKQTDRQVERVALLDTQRQFSGLQTAIQQIVSRMPPHHDYVVNLKRYLEKQKHG